MDQGIRHSSFVRFCQFLPPYSWIFVVFTVLSSKVQTSRQGEQWRKCACQRPVEQDLVLRAGLPWGQSDSDVVQVKCVVGEGGHERRPRPSLAPLPPY